MGRIELHRQGHQLEQYAQGEQQNSQINEK